MSASRRDRQSWEYANGPDVGGQVSITSEPREEHQPGVPHVVPDREPTDREATGGPHGDDNGAAATEEREVKAADPDLSPETNERLTRELRDVIGRRRVSVPADRPRGSRGEHPGRCSLWPLASTHSGR
jgi:hypothetical protein